MAGKTGWTLEKRKELKTLLEEGYSIKYIGDFFNIAFTTLMYEIEKGISKTELKEKRYIKYDYSRSIYNDALKRIGKEQLDLIIKEGKTYED